MMSRLTRAQLTVFALVAVISIAYGAVKLFHVEDLVLKPYQIEAQFETAGGIYPRADVDLLGTRVGSVREVKAGPGSGTTVVLAIDHGVEIPADVIATIGSKSAIGEQYVLLEPQSSDGPMLDAGSVISLDQTRSAMDVAQLLGNLDALAGSVPLDDLATVLAESSQAVADLGPTMGRFLDDSSVVVQTSLDHVEELTALIRDARTVLDTQVDLGDPTTAYLAQLASLTRTLRSLDGTLDGVLINGIRTTTEVSNLLSDTQAALPVMLTQLLTVTDVATTRTQALRKTLAVFPWLLELGGTLIRPCDEYDPTTGKPVMSTCHFDENGKPVYATYLGLQLPELPGRPPYLGCSKGYEGTVKYAPDGTALNGGPRQPDNSPPNLDARCAAAPTDPESPNVRGAQNAHSFSSALPRPAPSYGLALQNPDSGIVVTPHGTFRLRGMHDPAPPRGAAGLAWLLVQPMMN